MRHRLGVRSRSVRIARSSYGDRRRRSETGTDAVHHAWIGLGRVDDMGRVGKFRASRDERQAPFRSEEHTSELQSLIRISYAVFCLKKKITNRCEHKHQSTLISQTNTDTDT